jgi:hypothetical protein
MENADCGLRIENAKKQIEICFKFRNPQSAFYNEKAPLSGNGGGAFFTAELQTLLQIPIYPCRKSEQA